MPKTKRTYAPDFKRDAVQLVQTGGKSLPQIARKLGISKSALYRWRKELAELGNDAFLSRDQAALEGENRRLKRELERMEKERNTLKETIVIFSRIQL